MIDNSGTTHNPSDWIKPAEGEDPIGDENGPQFRLCAMPCTRVPPASPFFNPYGVWRLEPILKSASRRSFNVQAISSDRAASA
jgi:hypothetical protein